MSKHDIRIESVEFDLLILESDKSGALNKLKTIIDKFKLTIVDKFKNLRAERDEFKNLPDDLKTAPATEISILDPKFLATYNKIYSELMKATNKYISSKEYERSECTSFTQPLHDRLVDLLHNEPLIKKMEKPANAWMYANKVLRDLDKKYDESVAVIDKVEELVRKQESINSDHDTNSTLFHLKGIWSTQKSFFETLYDITVWNGETREDVRQIVGDHIDE